MSKARIKCAQCDQHLEFGGMSRSLVGAVSKHDAVAVIASQVGWIAKNGIWRCPVHALEDDLRECAADPAVFDAGLAHLCLDAAETVAAFTEALESIAANTCCDRCQEATLVARAALAKARSA